MCEKINSIWEELCDNSAIQQLSSHVSMSSVDCIQTAWTEISLSKIEKSLSYTKSTQPVSPDSMLDVDLVSERPVSEKRGIRKKCRRGISKYKRYAYTHKKSET